MRATAPPVLHRSKPPLPPDGWLAERHPRWVGLKSILSVTTRRAIKKTGKNSTETRLYITSLPPDPARFARAVRAHWNIENNLHWTLDVTFRKDECRVRKDHAARNLAMIRRAVLNMLRREPSKISLKRKRLKAAMSHKFRTSIIIWLIIYDLTLKYFLNTLDKSEKDSTRKFKKYT